MPDIFSNFPSYLSSNSVRQRAATAKSSHRLQNENARVQEMVDSFIECDKVSWIGEMSQLSQIKSTGCILPSAWLYYQWEWGVYSFYVL